MPVLVLWHSRDSGREAVGVVGHDAGITAQQITSLPTDFTVLQVRLGRTGGLLLLLLPLLAGLPVGALGLLYYNNSL